MGMALTTLKEFLRMKGSLEERIYKLIEEVSAGELGEDSVDTNEITDGAVTLDKMDDLADGKILIGDSEDRPGAVAPSGDVTIANDGTTTIGADKVVSGMVRIKAVQVTVAGESSTGQTVDEEVIDGEVLGFTCSNTESAIKTISFTPASGTIDVALNSAQGVGQDAVITVNILQTAPAE